MCLIPLFETFVFLPELILKNTLSPFKFKKSLVSLVLSPELNLGQFDHFFPTFPEKSFKLNLKQKSFVSLSGLIPLETFYRPKLT